MQSVRAWVKFLPGAKFLILNFLSFCSQRLEEAQGSTPNMLEGEVRIYHVFLIIMMA